MIFAEKIIRLRKKNGWSQEDLAEKMQVSRQSVSKWEGAQAVPDLGKILKLSELFGVTTDYLLKDELESEEFTGQDPEQDVKRVTLAEANAYLEQRKAASVRIALATVLCILSPIPLIILGAATEVFGVAETLAGVLGLITLFVIVAAAVAVFVTTGFQNAPYEFLEKSPFENEYGVRGMVKEKQKQYRNTYVRYNLLATCICILSPVPLLVGAFSANAFLMVILLCVTMVLAAVGVAFFIVSGVRWASMQKLLKEGDYAPKAKNKVKETVSTVYWLLATAVYLGISFAADNWESSWIVWPVAGVVYAAVLAVCSLLTEKQSQ